MNAFLIPPADDNGPSTSRQSSHDNIIQPGPSASRQSSNSNNHSNNEPSTSRTQPIQRRPRPSTPGPRQRGSRGGRGARQQEQVVIIDDDDEFEPMSDVTCTICLREKMDTALLECGHRFCNPCALIANQGNSCHCCRSKVKKIMKTFEFHDSDKFHRAMESFQSDLNENFSSEEQRTGQSLRADSDAESDANIGDNPIAAPFNGSYDWWVATFERVTKDSSLLLPACIGSDHGILWLYIGLVSCSLVQWIHSRYDNCFIKKNTILHF